MRREPELSYLAAAKRAPAVVGAMLALTLASSRNDVPSLNSLTGARRDRARERIGKDLRQVSSRRRTSQVRPSSVERGVGPRKSLPSPLPSASLPARSSSSLPLSFPPPSCVRGQGDAEGARAVGHTSEVAPHSRGGQGLRAGAAEFVPRAGAAAMTFRPSPSAARPGAKTAKRRAARLAAALASGVTAAVPDVARVAREAAVAERRGEPARAAAASACGRRPGRWGRTRWCADDRSVTILRDRRASQACCIPVKHGPCKSTLESSYTASTGYISTHSL